MNVEMAKKYGELMDKLKMLQHNVIYGPILEALDTQNHPFYKLKAYNQKIVALLEIYAPCTMSKLASLLGVAKNNIHLWVGELVRMGWIKRYPNPKNKRQIFVDFTETGLEINNERNRINNSTAQSIFDNTLDKNTQAELLTMLRREIEIFRRMYKSYYGDKAEEV